MIWLEIIGVVSVVLAVICGLALFLVCRFRYVWQDEVKEPTVRAR